MTEMTPRELAIYVGWDPREEDPYRVCEHSLRQRATCPMTIRPIKLDELRAAGLYHRATAQRDGKLWDVISEAPMATEFAVSRFFVPTLVAGTGSGGAQWAMFCDCDFLWLGDVGDVLGLLDPAKALMCVKHAYHPTEGVKMDGQAQLLYARKNWSSMMVFNLTHPAHERLTLDVLNGVPGRDLHRFCWLEDDEIGGLPEEWNWLEGWSDKKEQAPKAVHFTRGGPWMEGWRDVDYAADWLKEFEAVKLLPQGPGG